MLERHKGFREGSQPGLNYLNMHNQNRSNMAKYLGILVLLTLLGCGSEPNDKFTINIHQNGKSYSSKDGQIVLKKAPFSMIFSFDSVPSSSDTLFEIKYWATDNEEFYDVLKSATNLDSACNHQGGTNVHASYNNDESLTLNMNNGYSQLRINKRGSTGDLTHTFSNVERHDQRIDAWYKLSQFYQVPVRGQVKIEDLKENHLMFYFSLRGRLPGIPGEIEGHFVDIKFE